LQALFNKNTLYIILISFIFVSCGGTEGVVGDSSSQGSTSVSDATKNPIAGVPSNVEAKIIRDYKRALDAMKNGDSAKAEALLRLVSAANPELSGPYVNLGLLKFRAGDIEASELQFKKAIELNAKSAVSYNHMGIISRGRGEFKLARTFYQKALSIDPGYAYAHLNFGILLDIYIGELDLALTHYKRFQALTPDEDKDVRKWIIELQRRIKRQK